jgi:PDZ domain-containing protein
MARVTISKRDERATGTGADDPGSALRPPRVQARRRASTPDGIVIVIAAAIIIMAIFLFEISSYFAIRPGPAPDVTQLIEITGTKTKPVTGHLLLTTVSLQKITVAEAVRSWFDPNYEILPRSALVPPGGTDEDAQRETMAQMNESQEHAAAAALSFLGYDVKITSIGTRVVELSAGAPAETVLRRNDVIVGADESPIHKGEELRAVLARHKVGDTVVLKIRRGSSDVTVRTKTIGDPQDPTRAIIGVGLIDVPRVTLPLAVDIESLGIGGPSAGLMYALGIVELLDSTDMTKGRTIAGTGAIELNGVVQQVGGVRQKVVAARGAGAELFIVPLAELKEACVRAGDMPVVGVQNLMDAVATLRGAKVPAARTCG